MIECAAWRGFSAPLAICLGMLVIPRRFASRVKREAAIGEAFVPCRFIEIIIGHFRAFFEPISHFSDNAALSRHARIAAIFPAKLIFRRPRRIDKIKRCGSTGANHANGHQKQEVMRNFHGFHGTIIAQLSQRSHEDCMTNETNGRRNPPCVIALSDRRQTPAVHAQCDRACPDR